MGAGICTPQCCCVSGSRWHSTRRGGVEAGGDDYRNMLSSVRSPPSPYAPSGLSRHPPTLPHATTRKVTGFSSFILLLFVFLEAAASQTTTSTSPYSRAGRYAVATARLEILANVTPPRQTPLSGDGGGVQSPDGEEGELLVYYPTVCMGGDRANVHLSSYIGY